MKELYEQFGESNVTRMQAVFASIFILQNRIQTAYEKAQGDLTMKQWMMLTMISVCPKPHTLTNVGAYMGCSRQNAKQLAMALSKKGFVRLILGAQNSVNIETTDKAAEYGDKMDEKHAEALRIIFSDFSEKEMTKLYELFKKLYTGVEKLEKGLSL